MWLRHWYRGGNQKVGELGKKQQRIEQLEPISFQKQQENISAIFSSNVFYRPAFFDDC